MKRSTLLSTLLITSCLAASTPLHAATECNGLKVATGPASKGFSKLFADMAKVCGSEVALCEVNTNGAVDNLEVLSLKEADLGFAQIDSATALKYGNENIAVLQAVAGVGFSYLHAVVAAQGAAPAAGLKGWFGGASKITTIQRFSDLKGRRIALVGSAQLLGRQLDKQLSYGFDFVDVDSDAKAFELVKSGEAAAAFSIASWPNGALASLKQDSGLSLVPFDAPVFHPYIVRPISYRGLGVYNNNALAIPSLLLARPFKGERAQDVGRLQACLRTKLQELQEGSFQPGWNEVKNPDETFDWPRFQASLAEGDAGARARRMSAASRIERSIEEEASAKAHR